MSDDKTNPQVPERKVMAFTSFAHVLGSGSTTISFDLSEDESDTDHGRTPMHTLLLIRQATNTSNNDSKNKVQGLTRRIAGSGRVSSYHQKKSTPTHAAAPVPSVTGQVLQSITAIPALADRSFEEIRLECYNQSVIATGKPPPAVDATVNPSAVIPPLFLPVHDGDSTGEPGSSITMENI